MTRPAKPSSAQAALAAESTREALEARVAYLQGELLDALIAGRPTAEFRDCLAAAHLEIAKIAARKAADLAAALAQREAEVDELGETLIRAFAERLLHALRGLQPPPAPG